MPRISQEAESGSTILVVDDQEEVLVSLRQLLEREGHRVLTADSGDAALALLDEHEVHLVLVDYFMPRMTGDVLIRAIRARDPIVQIILQTGYSGEKPARMMLAELDIHAYHDKATGPDKLLVWVDVALKAHQTIRSLLERDRVFSELVSNVSHELRTPLNIIGGYAELLLDGSYGPMPETAKPALESVGDATAMLNELVKEVLGYAKLQVSSALETAPHAVDLYGLAREVGKLGALLVDDKRVTFRVETAVMPPTMVTDAGKLRAILRGLVTNAAKFTVSGEIVFRISGTDERVRFDLADTGPGIAPEDRDLIFEPFREPGMPDAPERSRGGRGLALSRKLARLLGGDIEVQSTVGRGSMFTLLLPTRPDRAVETSGASQSLAGGAAPETAGG